jgi:hypothetical protein
LKSASICIILDEYINMASFTAGPGGAMIATSGPAVYVPAAQNVTGGIIEAATAKTETSRAEAAAAFKNLGGGQKGGRRRRMKGGSAPANVPPTNLPSANSIPGVSHEGVMKSSVDTLNQIKASASYDGLRGSAAKLVGGRKKRSRKTKKNGRKHKRTHRRRVGRNSRVSRRNRHSV